MRYKHIPLPLDQIKAYCEQQHIRKLSLFGSIVRDDFTPESDVDIMIEFEPGYCVGLMAFSGMAEDLSALIGRRVDLKTPGFISPYFLDEVIHEAEVIYVAA